MKMNKIEGLDIQSDTDFGQSRAKSVFSARKSDASSRIKGRRGYSSLQIVKKIVREFSSRCLLVFIKSTSMRLQPYNELMPVNGRRHRWQSLGNDPYFILFPTLPALMRQGGWFHLEYVFECNEPVVQHIYIDYGIGYQPDVAVIHQAEQPRRATIPLFLPTTTRGIRLDPMSAPAEFTIKDVRLTKQDFSISSDRANHYLQTIDRLSFYLTSMGQTGRNMEADYEWVSHGIDPCFYAKPKYPGNSHAGWYLVTLSIENGWGEGDAKLYFDMGEDFNEKDSVAIPFENGSSVQRVVRFERNVIEFRFDPQEIKGAFSIHDLKLEALDEKLATDTMLRHVLECHADFAGLSVNESESAIKKTVASSANDHWLDALLSVYGETFILKGDLTNKRLKYWEWIEHVENDRWPDSGQVDSFLEQPELPAISIVLPVYNTPEKLLRDCIESVCSQSYPHWELCITDDASTLSHVEQVLAEYEHRDDRIKVISRKYNGHISRASNNALAAARGDYVALLDHDDLLSPHALFFMAQAVQENPGAAVLYSDEDKIDGEDNRFEPHFKCDWNLDLFLSQNYISHLGVYKMEILEMVGGFREGIEGSQDQDLLLRCLRLIQPDDIVHVPYVLYHWRALEGSTALATEEKDYTTNAGIKALQDYMNDQGAQGARVTQGLAPNTYRIQWPLPSSEPLVSLLMPTRDRREITELAVRSILDKTTYRNYEIIIIDNGSVEADTLAFFQSIQQSDARVRVIRYSLPFNYSAINNFGARHANGNILGLINNDVEVISADWLTEMVSHVVRKEVGCVGAKLFYSDDTIQHAGVIVGLGGVAGHSHKHFPRQAAGYFNRLKLVQSLSAVTAACLLVRREIYDELGGLNEEDLKVAFNDVDFCLRVRESGYRNVWTPYAELYHHESISRGHEDTPEKVARFAKEVEYMKARWGNFLVSDPYYSPHLTRAREDFSIGGPNA